MCALATSSSSGSFPNLWWELGAFWHAAGNNRDSPGLRQTFPCSGWHLLVERSLCLQEGAWKYTWSLIHAPKSNAEFISVNVPLFVWVILWAKGGRFVAGRQGSWQYWNESKINLCRGFYRQHFSWAMNKWDYAVAASKAFLWFCLVCLFCSPHTKELLVGSVTLSEDTESQVLYGNLRWHLFVYNQCFLALACHRLLASETSVKQAFLSASGLSYMLFFRLLTVKINPLLETPSEYIKQRTRS